jgi:hypothetical protein
MANAGLSDLVYAIRRPAFPVGIGANILNLIGQCVGRAATARSRLSRVRKMSRNWVGVGVLKSQRRFQGGRPDGLSGTANTR